MEGEKISVMRHVLERRACVNFMRRKTAFLWDACGVVLAAQLDNMAVFGDWKQWS